MLLTELAQRITVAEVTSPEQRKEKDGLKFEYFHTILSLLSYLMKAPVVPEGAPVVNALAAQRQCIVNVLRACVGLPAENYMSLEHRVPALMASNQHGGCGVKRGREEEAGNNYVKNGTNGHANGYSTNGHVAGGK